MDQKPDDDFTLDDAARAIRASVQVGETLIVGAVLVLDTLHTAAMAACQFVYDAATGKYEQPADAPAKNVADKSPSAQNRSEE